MTDDECRLLPCPFCEPARSRADFINERGDYWFIRCFCCWARGPLCINKEKAKETWNARSKLEDVSMEAGVLAMRSHEHLICGMKFKSILPVAEARGLAKACASAWHLTAKE